MNDTTPQKLGLLARLIVVLAFVMIAAGVVWHGFTVRTFLRIWHNLLGRSDGPMRFRFVLQPAMATLAALRDGRNDARNQRSPYLSAILSKPAERADRLREGANATARIILLGVVMDMIYQALVFRTSTRTRP